MTYLSELKQKLRNSKNSDYLNTLELTINYYQIEESIKLTGFYNIYKYIYSQQEGWFKSFNLPNQNFPNQFNVSKEFFNAIRKRLDSEMYPQLDGEENNFKRLWDSRKSMFTTRKDIFPYNHGTVDFLLSVYNTNSNSFEGAYKYIIGNYSSYSKNDLIGFILAYEFMFKDSSDIVKRKDSEKRSIAQLRSNMSKLDSEFNNKLIDSDKKLEKHHLKISEKNKTLINEIEETIDSKSKETDEWFSESKRIYIEWEDDQKMRIEKLEIETEKKARTLEKTYEELLRLKKPAEYWKLRAKTLMKAGWKSIYYMIGLLIVGIITLYFLLWQTPEGMLASFFSGDKALAIKWSIIYITFISFIAYGIRITHKVAFSSFHLARDAEEREHLAFFYLALLQENAVGKEERNLIMQSLFSRADSGLLKEDSSPTMPAADVIGSVIQKSR